MTTGTKNILLLNAVTLLAAVIAVATFGHGVETKLKCGALAFAFTSLGLTPPLVIQKLFSHGAARQLVVVLWRFPVLLLAAWTIRYVDVEERNCFITALLACYFISLTLESWLLVRGVRDNAQ